MCCIDQASANYDAISRNYAAAAFVFSSEKSGKRSFQTRIPSIVTSTAIVTLSTFFLPNDAFAEGSTFGEGQALFTQNCASCHLNGQNVMKPQRDLQKQTLLKFFGATESDVVEVDPILSWIEKSGQHKRLFFPNVPGGKLTDEDYGKVINYIVDQANNDKW